MTLLSPVWLWLLLAVLALVVAQVLVARRRRTYAARFTDLSLLASVVPRRPSWIRRYVPAALLLLGITSLIVSIARPASQVKTPKERATVVLAIDVSNSMAATDVSPTRLASAQQGALSFVDALPRKLQLGLVSFSGSAQVLVPPTTDREQIRDGIRALTLGPGTAIGEGVFASLSTIAATARSTTTPDGVAAPPVPARIVLLSDGETTRGRPNSDAGQAALEANTPVSTIAYGTPDGTLEIQGQTISVPVNTQALQELADQTHGSYHRAQSGDELRSVYQGLGSSIGYDVRTKEIGRVFTAVGLGLSLLAAALGMLWAGRLP